MPRPYIRAPMKYLFHPYELRQQSRNLQSSAAGSRFPIPRPLRSVPTGAGLQKLAVLALAENCLSAKGTHLPASSSWRLSGRFPPLHRQGAAAKATETDWLSSSGFVKQRFPPALYPSLSRQIFPEQVSIAGVAAPSKVIQARSILNNTMRRASRYWVPQQPPPAVPTNHVFCVQQNGDKGLQETKDLTVGFK
jgi:hypothetical protein